MKNTIPKYYKDLSKQGYYLRVSHGTFKNREVTEYMIFKKTSETGGKIANYINKIAFQMLKPYFEVKKDKHETVFLNRVYDNLFFQNSKEPKTVIFN